MVFIEAKVLISSYDPNDPGTHGCNKEGSHISICFPKNQSFTRNMKEFIIAASGFDPQGNPRPTDDTVTEAECAAAISEQQPFAGAVIYVEARQVPTRTGGQFTATSFWPARIGPDGQVDQSSLPR
jgi:hypothetical protein